MKECIKFQEWMVDDIVDAPPVMLLELPGTTHMGQRHSKCLEDCHWLISVVGLVGSFKIYLYRSFHVREGRGLQVAI